MSFLTNIPVGARSMNGLLSFTDGINTYEDGGIQFGDGTTISSMGDIVGLSANNQLTGLNNFSADTTFSTLSSSGDSSFNSLNVITNETVGGSLTVGGISSVNQLKLNDTMLYIHTETDANHSLVYNAGVDGPILSGWRGGMLKSNEVSGIALQWNPTNVTIGYTTISSSNSTGSLIVGGGVGVGGKINAANLNITGESTLNALSVTNNEIIGGTLTVTGTSSVSTISSSGAATLNSLFITGASSVNELTLNNNPLYLRSYQDSNHSLVYDATLDGPILSGWTSGALKSKKSTENALQWNETDVTIGYSTPSSSNTTGSLLVKGGIGCEGRVSALHFRATSGSTLNSLTVSTDETVEGTLSVVGLSTLNLLQVTNSVIVGGESYLHKSVDVTENISCNGAILGKDFFYYNDGANITDIANTVLITATGTEVLCYTIETAPFANHEVLVNVPFSGYFSFGSVAYQQGFINGLTITPTTNANVKIYRNGIFYKNTTATYTGMVSSYLRTFMPGGTPPNSDAAGEQYIGNFSFSFLTYHSFTTDTYTAYMYPEYTTRTGPNYSNVIYGLRLNCTNIESITGNYASLSYFETTNLSGYTGPSVTKKGLISHKRRWVHILLEIYG
jgi:hypothetical protein